MYARYILVFCSWNLVASELVCPTAEYTAIVTRIDTSDSEIKTVRDELPQLQNTKELQELIDTIRDLEYFPTDFDGFQLKIGRDVADLTTRIDGIQLVYDTRIGGIDTSVSDLNTDLDASNVKFEGLKNDLASCKAKISALEAESLTIGESINNLRDSTDAIKAKEGSLAASMDSFGAKLDVFNTEVEAYPEGKLFRFFEWGEWSDCSTTCDLGIQQRTRECPVDECLSEDMLSGVDTRPCDPGELCPIVDSGKILILAGVQDGPVSIDVPSDILDVRTGTTCSAPTFATDYGDGIFGTFMWNMFPVIAGGDSIKEVIHVFKQDGTVNDIKVSGDGSSRKYAAAITLADKQHMYMVGGYYSAEGEVTDSTEVIHLNREGTEASGEHGPDIPKKLVFPCFTDFVDSDGNRNFFLFGGSQTVDTDADTQKSNFNTKGWVLAESDFNATDDNSWDNAVETPEFTDFTMAYIVCKAFKTSSGDEHIMIVGNSDDSNTLIYNPVENTFKTGPVINLPEDGLTMSAFYQSSIYTSTVVENEVVLTGGYFEYKSEDGVIDETESYSNYVFKMTCPESETDAANCPFEVQDQELKKGRHSHVSFHIPNAFATCS